MTDVTSPSSEINPLVSKKGIKAEAGLYHKLGYARWRPWK